MASDQIAFRAGDYEVACASGVKVTVHVPHDVTADDIAPALAGLARSIGTKKGEKDAA